MYSTDTDKQFVDFDKLQNWIPTSRQQHKEGINFVS